MKYGIFLLHIPLSADQVVSEADNVAAVAMAPPEVTT
jgi:hypothetical protein